MSTEGVLISLVVVSGSAAHQSGVLTPSSLTRSPPQRSPVPAAATDRPSHQDLEDQRTSSVLAPTDCLPRHDTERSPVPAAATDRPSHQDLEDQWTSPVFVSVHCLPHQDMEGVWTPVPAAVSHGPSVTHDFEDQWTSSLSVPGHCPPHQYFEELWTPVPAAVSHRASVTRSQDVDEEVDRRRCESTRLIVGRLLDSDALPKVCCCCCSSRSFQSTEGWPG